MKIGYFNLAVGIATLALGPRASAVIVDLTTAGSSGSANGAFFQQITPQSTGTGVIDPFLRIQANGTEHGFNNNVNKFTLDDVAKGGQTYNHDIQLSHVPVVTLGGKAYYQFLLDINQNSANSIPPGNLLSMHEMEIWLKSTPITTLSNPKGVYSDLSGSGAVKSYDLDLGADGDSVVELNYDLNPGSGAGDMFAYVPVSALGGDLTQYVYLYSAFGNPNSSNDGFEEWATLQAGGSVPDGGSTVMLLGCAFAGIGLIRNKLARK